MRSHLKIATAFNENAPTYLDLCELAAPKWSKIHRTNQSIANSKYSAGYACLYKFARNTISIFQRITCFRITKHFSNSANAWKSGCIVAQHKWQTKKVATYKVQPKTYFPNKNSRRFFASFIFQATEGPYLRLTLGLMDLKRSISSHKIRFIPLADLMIWVPSVERRYQLFGSIRLFHAIPCCSTIRLPESSPPKVLTNLWALGVCGKARSPLR